MNVSSDDKWLKCLEIINKNIPNQHYITWFEPIQYVSYKDDTLTLSVPNKFFAGFFDNHFASYLLKVVSYIYGAPSKLVYKFATTPVVNEAKDQSINDETSSEEKKNVANKVQQRQNTKFDSQLNLRYSFSNFVEGESNKLSKSVGLSIAENPGKNTFNPFFLYGPSGVGKTHLVNAIGVRIRELYPEKRVLFVSAHVFKTQYTDSVIHNTSNDFINFYQTIDVLIIDDIQEITTAKTQQAFFHIFNHLQQNNNQIIITCDRPPVSLEGMEERMLTRFKWGMTVEMEKPDIQLRKAILISKIRRDGLVIPQEVIQYISNNVESSVREIEGIVNSIMAYSVTDNCEVDLELTKRVVSRAVNMEKRELTSDDIVAVVCKRSGIKQKEIVSKSRKHNIVQARQMAMYICHKYTDMPYSQIGRRFGNRDHSTVLYACNQVAHRISVDKTFRREIEDIESVLV